MGAWSEENFGNDDANDWVWQLENSKGLETLLSPINSVLSTSEYLESPLCCDALAAAETVAAGLTGDFSKIPEEAQKWLNTKQSLFGKKPQIQSEHARLARIAVTKILESSELKELWEETDDYSSWQTVQSALLNKLDSV